MGVPLLRTTRLSVMLIKTEQSEIIQGAIDRLPPKQREVVTLYYMQHLKYREIAEILDVFGRHSCLTVESGTEES